MKPTLSMQPVIRSSTVNRAELLELLHLVGDKDLASVAHLAGFTVSPQVVKLETVPSGSIVGKAEPQVVSRPSLERSHAAIFYRVTAVKVWADEEEPLPESPDFEVEPYTTEELSAPQDKQPPSQALIMPWSQCWPVISALMSRPTGAKKLQLDKLVRHLAQGSMPHRLPFKRNSHFASPAQVLLDFNPRCYPFNADFHRLAQRLSRQQGRAGLEIVQFEQGPDGPCRTWWGDHSVRMSHARLHSYVLPPADTPILILSDLGCYDPSGAAVRAWLYLGQLMQAAGLRPVALLPVPQRLWPLPLGRYFQLLSWDRGQKLAQSRQGRVGRFDQEKNDAVETLLAALLPTVQVEPALLRAMAHLFPRQKMDVGAEGEAWLHHYCCHDPLRMAVLREYKESGLLAARFVAFAPELKLAIWQLIETQHQYAPLPVRIEECIHFHSLLDKVEDNALKDLKNKLYHQISEYLERLSYTLKHSEAHAQAIKDWSGRFSHRQMGRSWQNPKLARLFTECQPEQFEQGNIDLPEGLLLHQLLPYLSKEEPEDFQLYQWGGELWLRRATTQLEHQSFNHGSLLARFSTCLPSVQYQAEQQAASTLLLKGAGPWQLDKALTGTGVLNSDQHHIIIEALKKPSWATAIACDSQGLYAEFTVGQVVQRMRWILPGSFMMGSPSDEAGRFDNETQHKVNLTQGFWLADTTCTQALWQAVTGKNPSEFKGEQLPVERVSWKDGQDLLDQINQQQPKLELRLPTEAEWEYACRAGTDTPFNFGKQLSTEQANYDGNHPYSGGKKGKYRGKTLPAKHFTSNAWGLYQMHGNVWEWCSDWYGDYSGDAINPPGPNNGKHRLLRGGAWINSGRYLRSAQRDHDAPGYRDPFIGFRLARA